MTKRRRHRFYPANKPALGPLPNHLEAMWLDRLQHLKHLVETEERSN